MLSFEAKETAHKNRWSSGAGSLDPILWTAARVGNGHYVDLGVLNIVGNVIWERFAVQPSVSFGPDARQVMVLFNPINCLLDLVLETDSKSWCDILVILDRLG